MSICLCIEGDVDHWQRILHLAELFEVFAHVGEQQTARVNANSALYPFHYVVCDIRGEAVGKARVV